MTKEDTQQPFAVLGAAWLWHGSTITVQDTPTNVIKPGEAATIWLEIGHHGRVNQARLVYTTDGTEPEGHQDEVENGKLVTLELERTEPTSSGYAMWWRGTIPPQTQGTPVRYKLYAWHSNGGPLLYAESPTGKAVYTSKTATTFGYYVSDIAPPAWVKDAIIYQVLIDRFFDADPNRNIDTPSSGSGSPEPSLFGWNGGDLAGIEARLDYLKYLGINTLWLSPIYENPASQIGSEYDTVAGVIKNYHGYEAVDMNEVEDNFGTLKDFKRLVDAAHAAGMRIILDFVANHTSNQHPHFKDASDRCQDSPYYNWYKFGKVDHQGKLVRYESACCTPGHNRWWGDNDEYATFFGVKEMPQLDNDYGPTRQAMLEQALKWIQLYGVDGLRLDYAPGPGHSFWMAFKTATKALNPHVYLLGEVWTERGAEERKEFEGELDGVLGFDHNDLFLQFFAWNSISVEAFDSGLTYFEQYYHPEYTLPTFLDNHDKDRFLFESGQDIERLKLALLVQMTLPNPPVIYYGTEVGLTQKQPSQGKPEYSRGRMPWGNYLDSPPDGWETEQNVALREFVRQLIALRKEYPALRYGSRNTLYQHNENRTLAYQRAHNDAQVVVALNNSPHAQELYMPNIPGATLPWKKETVIEERLSGKIYQATDNQLRIKLQPRQGAILAPVNPDHITWVTFTVEGYITKVEEYIYIVSDAPELGSWDPDQATQLDWVDSNTWSGKVPFDISRGKTISYKFIVRKSNTIVWESGNNRTIQIPTKGSREIVNIWQTWR